MKTFDEGYLVKFDFFNEETGFWVTREETVFVKVEHGVNEKGNHNKAEKIIKEKYYMASVRGVKYI